LARSTIEKKVKNKLNLIILFLYLIYFFVRLNRLLTLGLYQLLSFWALRLTFKLLKLAIKLLLGGDSSHGACALGPWQRPRLSWPGLSGDLVHA
jgi:hypothetical protein